MKRGNPLRRFISSRQVSSFLGISLVALVALGGCSTPQEKKSLQELIDQQTPILKELASFQSERQRRGVNRFLKLGKNQGSEVAVWFLNDPTVADNERVRVLLAWILASWKDRRGMPYLIDSLESRDLGVLRLAEEGLVNYGPDDPLARHLGAILRESMNADARLTAARVLSRMKMSNAVDILGAHLRRKAESEREVRGNCILGVVDSLPSHERLGYLVDSLADPDVEIRELAWAALKREEKFWKVVNRPEKIASLYHPASEPGDMADSIASIRRWLKEHGARVY